MLFLRPAQHATDAFSAPPLLLCLSADVACFILRYLLEEPEHIRFQSHDERNCCSSVGLLPQLTPVPVRRATLDPAELRPTPLTNPSLLAF